MLSIKEEMIAFIMAIITGVIVRIFYCCLTCFRGIVRHSLLAVEIEDFLFWIGSAIYIFVQIYHTSNGSMRWYFALGVVIGVSVSTIFLKKTKNVTKKIYDFHSGKNIAKSRKKRYYNKY